jgi:DNA-binding FadR family transcriptional regulator
MSTAIIKPVKRTSTTESTVETIQELILSGHWMPRQAIPSQKELAAVLGVSRTVVREASEILKQRGLIKIIHGGGMFVATPSLSGLQDALELFVGFSNVSPLELCDMRLLIETELARLAAKNSTQASTSELTRLVRLLDSTVNIPDQHILADLEFHTEIGRLARQSVLSAIVQSLQRPIQQSMYLGMSGQENVTRSDEQHRAIYEAIIAGDETLAAARMREHQLFIRDYVERAIETNV